MLLFVNGDEHVAGAKIENDYILSTDDPRFKLITCSLHPDNLNSSWSSTMANAMSSTLINKAPCNNNTKIIEINEKWVEKNGEHLDPGDVFMIIGWFNDEHILIRNYHLYLKDSGIKHLFFGNTELIDYDYDFKECLVSVSYKEYLEEEGFIMENNFYKKDGHTAWAKYLIKHIIKHNMI